MAWDDQGLQAVLKKLLLVFSIVSGWLNDWSILLRGVLIGGYADMFHWWNMLRPVEPWYPMLVTSRVEAAGPFIGVDSWETKNATNNYSLTGDVSFSAMKMVMTWGLWNWLNHIRKIMRFDGNSPWFSSNLINSSGCQHFPSIKMWQWCQFKIWSLVPQKLIMESL